MRRFLGLSRRHRAFVAKYLLAGVVIAIAVVLIVIDLLRLRRAQALASQVFVVTPPGTTPDTQRSIQDYVAKRGYDEAPVDEGCEASSLLLLLHRALQSLPDGATVMVVREASALPPGALILGAGFVVIRPQGAPAPGLIAVRNSEAAREAVSYMWSVCDARGFDEAAAIADYMHHLRAIKEASGAAGMLPIYVLQGWDAPLHEAEADPARYDAAPLPSPDGLSSLRPMEPDVERVRISPVHGAEAELDALRQMAAVDAAWRGQREALLEAYRDARAGKLRKR